MLYTLVGIFLLTYHVGCNITVQHEDKGVFRCVEDIVHDLFGNESILFVNNRNYSEFKFDFNTKLIFSHYDELPDGHNNVVVDSSSKANKLYDRLMKIPGSEKNILFIYQGSDTINYKKIMLKFWWKKKSKLAIARIHNGKIELFTNFPIKTENVCPNFHYEKYDDYCSQLSAVKVKVNIKKYCALDVGYVVDFPFVDDIHSELNPGIVVSLIRTYKQMRMVTVNYVDSEVYQDEFLNNGTIHKLSRHLMENKIQIAIGHLFMNRTDVNPFYNGPLIFKDYIEFVWRKFLRLGSFQKMTIVFDSVVWYSFGLTFLIVVAVYFLINLIVKEQVEFTVFLTDLFGVAVGTGLSRTPNSTPLRILALFYLTYCLTIDSAYLGKLSSILTKPLSNKQENIWLSGVRCHISHYVGRVTNLYYLFVSTRSMIPQLTKSQGTGYVNLTHRFLLERLAATQQNSTLLFHSLMKTMPTEASMVDHGIFEALKVSLFCTYYIGNFTALKDSLQFWSQQIIEMGFVIKWMRDITGRRKMTDADIESVIEPLKLEHFDILFKALLLGYLVATTQLVAEIVYKKLDTKYCFTDRIRAYWLSRNKWPVFGKEISLKL